MARGVVAHTRILSFHLLSFSPLNMVGNAFRSIMLDAVDDVLAYLGSHTFGRTRLAAGTSDI